MKNKCIATENFSSGKRNFFLDFMIASNKTNYIKITRTDENQDGSYTRKNVVIFQEDFEFLISAFSSLFSTASHKEEQEKTVLDLFNQANQNRQEKGAKGIKAWDPHIRPREKFLHYGTGALSDAELIAMLIGSGTPNTTAVDLANKILKTVEGNLKKLASLQHTDLAVHKGMGLARSSAILAALELGRRAFAFSPIHIYPKGKKPFGKIIR